MAAAAAAVSHSPRPQLVRADEASKRRKTDEVEEKEHQAELAVPAFDPGPLCGSIALELMDGKRPRAAAERVMMTSPEMLFSLSPLEKQELMGLVDKHLMASSYTPSEERDIHAAVLILYSTSLVNSSAGETARSLEKDLFQYMELSKKKHVQELLQRAENFLPLRINISIDAIKKRLAEIVVCQERSTDF